MTGGELAGHINKMRLTGHVVKGGARPVHAVLPFSKAGLPAILQNRIAVLGYRPIGGMKTGIGQWAE
jgi:hypothetical protein